MLKQLKSEFWEFIQRLWASWFSRMSGGLSVPLGIIGIYFSGGYVQAAFLTTSFICFIAAFFYIWKEQHDKVEDLERKLDPKLRLHFDQHDEGCFHRTSNKLGSLLMIRVLPICDARLKSCEGYVDAVWSLDINERWLDTEFDEKILLKWSLKGSTSPIPLQKNQRQFLDVCSIHSLNNKIALAIDGTPNRAINVFQPTGVYRIDIGVANIEGNEQATISLKISMARELEDIRVEKI